MAMTHPEIGDADFNVTAASQAPCAVNQAILDTSFRQKCLRLRCHDFSALANWSPKQTSSCTLHAW